MNIIKETAKELGMTYAKGKIIELYESRTALVSEHGLALARICGTVKAEQNTKALWGDAKTEFTPVDTTLAKSTLDNLEQIQQNIEETNDALDTLVKEHDLGALLEKLEG